MSLISTIKSSLNRFGMVYVRMLCAREYNKQVFLGINERPIEFAFLLRQIVEIWPKTILDVGTGKTSLPHLLRTCGFLVTATDNIKDYWPKGMVNRHYHVINDDIVNSKLTDKFDVITCISVLEHIHEHRKAMGSMYNLLKPGGRLILTCPYNEEHYAPNVYQLPESNVQESFSFVTQAFSRYELNEWLSENPYELIEQEYWQYFEGEYWTCGVRLAHPIQVAKSERHQLCCMSFRKPV